MLVLQNEVSSQYDPKGVTNEDNQEDAQGREVGDAGGREVTGKVEMGPGPDAFLDLRPRDLRLEVCPSCWLCRLFFQVQ